MYILLKSPVENLAMIRFIVIASERAHSLVFAGKLLRVRHAKQRKRFWKYRSRVRRNEKKKKGRKKKQKGKNRMNVTRRFIIRNARVLRRENEIASSLFQWERNARSRKFASLDFLFFRWKTAVLISLPCVCVSLQQITLVRASLWDSLVTLYLLNDDSLRSV